MFRRRTSGYRRSPRFRFRRARSSRGLYPHQGGRWQRAQFCFDAQHASSEETDDILWSDMMGVSEHVANYLSNEGSVMGQMIRYVEVRAIRMTISGLYAPTAPVNAVFLTNKLFAGVCVDTFDRDNPSGGGAPESAPLFTPFSTEKPVRDITAITIPTTPTDITQPTRWLRTDWSAFNGGALNGAAAFQSTSAEFKRHFTISKRFRLDDHHKLYVVTAFQSNAVELQPTIYTFNVAGAIWYRTIF